MTWEPKRSADRTRVRLAHEDVSAVVEAGATDGFIPDAMIRHLIDTHRPEVLHHVAEDEAATSQPSRAHKRAAIALFGAIALWQARWAPDVSVSAPRPTTSPSAASATRPTESPRG